METLFKLHEDLESCAIIKELEVNNLHQLNSTYNGFYSEL